MNITNDPQILAMIFILPSLFGFSLIGDGVCKIMNYEQRGWIGIITGSSFLLVILLGFLLINGHILN